MLLARPPSCCPVRLFSPSPAANHSQSHSHLRSAAAAPCPPEGALPTPRTRRQQPLPPGRLEVSRSTSGETALVRLVRCELGLLSEQSVPSAGIVASST